MSTHQDGSSMDMPLLAPLAEGGVEKASAKSAKSAAAYRTISEVAEELDLPQHVLRFWETKFPQIRPMKRAGGRRFYRPEDVELLRLIKGLLHQEGYTIKGVRKVLKETGGKLVILGSAKAAAKTDSMRAARKHLAPTPTEKKSPAAPVSVIANQNQLASTTESMPSLNAEQKTEHNELPREDLRQIAKHLRSLEAEVRGLLG